MFDINETGNQSKNMKIQREQETFSSSLNNPCCRIPEFKDELSHDGKYSDR